MEIKTKQLNWLLTFSLYSNISIHVIFFRSADGNTLIVASTDGYCSIINFQAGQLGTIYTAPPTEVEDILDESAIEEDNAPNAEAKNSPSAEESMETEEDTIEDEDEQDENVENDLNVSKEGFLLDSEGVSSPAEIKIRQVTGSRQQL